MADRVPADQVTAVPAIVELPRRAQLSLRMKGGPVAAAVAHVLGVAAPTASNSFVDAADCTVLWLGPDEWLVLADLDRGAALAEALQEAVGADGAVIDVSAQRVGVELAGPGARDVLARGCSIDLDPRVSPTGTCVQTLLARTGVIIVVRDAGAERFELLVRSSFAPYLFDWLADSAG